MKNIYILCVDDEPEVLEAIERDIAGFEEVFPIETAESVDEAENIIEKIYAAGDECGLILCDHIMPDKLGVDFLANLKFDPRTKQTKKVLITGQAGLNATIQAINECHLNHYIAKPWKGEELKKVTRDQLTDYVIEKKLNPMPYMTHLDTTRLSEEIHKHGLISDE